MTHRLLLAVDQGITFLFSLFAHDPFHDMYFSHGTGKTRAENFWGDHGGKVDDRPGLRAHYGGGNQKGGAGTITVTEVDVNIALKMGIATIPTLADKIFLNIDARPEQYCKSDVTMAVYLDTDAAIDTATAASGGPCPCPNRGPFLPGWVVIQEEVLSPFELNLIESPPTPAGAGYTTLASFQVINGGPHQGYKISINVVHGGGDGAQIFLFIQAPNGDSMQLNRLSDHLECVQKGRTSQGSEIDVPGEIQTIMKIESKLYESIKQQIEVSFDDFLQARINGTSGLPFDKGYTPQKLLEAHKSVFYYLCVKTGILNVDVAIHSIGGKNPNVYLLNEILTTPDPILNERQDRLMWLASQKAQLLLDELTRQGKVEEQQELLELLKYGVGTVTVENITLEITSLINNLVHPGQPLQPPTCSIKIGAARLLQTEMVGIQNQFPCLTALININRSFYNDPIDADRGFLVTLSKMCTTYYPGLNTKPAFDDLRTQLLNIRAQMIAGGLLQEGGMEEFIYILSDQLKYKELEIEVDEEEDVEEDEEDEEDEEEEDDMDLQSYIDSLGIPADQDQANERAAKIKEKILSLGPELIPQLTQIPLDRAQTQNEIMQLLTQAEQGQIQSAAAAELLKISPEQRQIVINAATAHSLNLESLTSLQQLTYAMQVLQMQSPQAQQMERMGGGGGSSIGVLYDQERAASAATTIKNAIVGEDNIKNALGYTFTNEQGQVVSVPPQRTNNVLEVALNEAFRPLMQGEFGSIMFAPMSKGGYLAVKQLPIKRIQQKAPFMGLFPSPQEAITSGKLSKIIKGSALSDKAKEKIRTIKANLLRIDAEAFKELYDKLDPATFDPNSLSDSFLTEQNVEVPLANTSKKTAGIYNTLKEIFQNVSSALNLLYIVLELGADQSTGPPVQLQQQGMYDTPFDYYFERKGDFRALLIMLFGIDQPPPASLNDFAALARPYPSPGFFGNAVVIMEIIAKLKGKKLPFNALGRLNNGYVMGSIAAIMVHCLDNAPSSGKAKTLFTEEKRMISNLLTKGASGQYDKLLNNQAPPNDTKLVTSILNGADFYNRQGKAQVITKWPATAGAGVKVSLFTDMVAEGWGGILNTMKPGQPLANKRFFVNNAVTMAADRLDISKQHFCPTPSIIDAMTSICSKLDISIPYGVEWGIMDFMVQCPLPQDGGQLFSYRIRVEPNVKKSFNQKQNVPKLVNISAYLQVRIFNKDGTVNRDLVLINVYKGAENGPPPPEITWPGGYHEGYEVDLASSGASGPLSARASMENLQYFIDTIPVVTGYTDTYENLIDTLHNKAGGDVFFNIDAGYISGLKPKWREFFPQGPYTVDDLRRGIIEHSFRKSLGDYLQEMTTIVTNGGYTDGPYYSKGGADVRLPNQGRFGLHNDRPAAARAILLTLFAEDPAGSIGVNPNTLSGLVVTDKQNRLNYVVAGRGCNEQDYQRWVASQGGGKKQRKAKKKRTRRNIKKKKKTRKAKPKRGKTRKARKPKKKTRGKRNKKKSTK